MARKNKKNKVTKYDGNNIDFTLPMFCVRGIRTGITKPVQLKKRDSYNSIDDKLTEQQLRELCDNGNFEFSPNIAHHWKVGLSPQITLLIQDCTI